jgi:hypothetical protein
MPEDPTAVGLSRRSCFLLAAAEYHASQSAEVVENTAIVILFERRVETFGTLRRRGVVREAAEDHRQCCLDRRVYRRRFGAYVAADFLHRRLALLRAKKVLK